MSTPADETAAREDSQPVRSTRAVVGILGSIIGAIVLVLVVILLVRSGSLTGSSASRDLARSSNADRIQAVYLADDSVYFGRVRAGHGDWILLKDAYFLRRAAADAAAKGETSASQTEIVPVSQAVGGTGDMRINVAQITVVQDLAARSDIASTIEDATR